MRTSWNRFGHPTDSQYIFSEDVDVGGRIPQQRSQVYTSIHMQRGGYLRRRIEDTIPEIYLLQALADEPLTDLRGCDLSERERVMEACRICMPQRRNRRHALSKVRHATSVQNRLVDQRRNVRQRIPRVKRTRRFPAGGQINADQCSADLCESMQQEQQMVGLSCMVA